MHLLNIYICIYIYNFLSWINMRSETARSPVVHEEVECTSLYHPNDCRLHRQRLLTYPASLNHAYVRLAFLSPRERSLRPIFLHEGPLAVAPTIITGWRTCARPTWPLRWLVRSTNVAVSSAALSQRTATARDVANNFFRTRKSSRAAFISFSYHHRSSVLVFLSFFMLPLRLPLVPSSFCLLYMPASLATPLFFRHYNKITICKKLC